MYRSIKMMMMITKKWKEDRGRFVFVLLVLSKFLRPATTTTGTK